MRGKGVLWGGGLLLMGCGQAPRSSPAHEGKEPLEAEVVSSDRSQGLLIQLIRVDFTYHLRLSVIPGGPKAIAIAPRLLITQGGRDYTLDGNVAPEYKVRQLGDFEDTVFLTPGCGLDMELGYAPRGAVVRVWSQGFTRDPVRTYCVKNGIVNWSGGAGVRIPERMNWP